MSESDRLAAAKNLIRRQGGQASPSIGTHVPEVRTPVKWKASAPTGQQFRPDAFELVVWNYGVPFTQVEAFHDWLATNEITLAQLCDQATNTQAQYLGTYLHTDVGAPRYQTLWGLRGSGAGTQAGDFNTDAAEAALDAALAPNTSFPLLRDLVIVLRSYWVRDGHATDHRYGQARHYIDLPAQGGGCFWDVTRKARSEPPV